MQTFIIKMIMGSNPVTHKKTYNIHTSKNDIIIKNI